VVLIEVVRGRGLDAGEFLKTLHAPEAENQLLPSAKQHVRVFSSVVQTTAGFLSGICTDLLSSKPRIFDQDRDTGVGRRRF
jgi:hypothetical protein